MKSMKHNSQPEINTGKSSVKGFLAASFIRFAGCLPLRVGQRIGKRLGRLMVWMNTREVKIARRNISLCFPDMEDKRKEEFLIKVFENGGMQLFETAFLWRADPDASLAYIKKINGEDLLDEALQNERGLVLILPHVGNWEMLNAYMLGKMELKAMYTPARLAEVDRLMFKGRSKTGLELSAANLRGISSMISTLRNGGNLIVLPDQEPVKGSGEFAPFFGIEAYSMTLISKMLQKSGAKTLLAYVNRLDDGEGIEFFFKPISEDIYSNDIRVSVTALNKAVEESIRENPEQYMWGYKRFRHRPEGSENLYKNLV